MTIAPSAPIVGVFRDRSMAEQAIDALYTAGFTSEQVRYSVPGTTGSIFSDLKNLFTGQNANSESIAHDLTTMGLSDEEAHYYSNEYTNGNTVLAVLSGGRDQEALSILNQYGAYHADTRGSVEATAASTQPSVPAQQTPYPLDHGARTWSADTGERPLQTMQEETAFTPADTENRDEVSHTAYETQNPEYRPAQDVLPDQQSASQAIPVTQPVSTNTPAPATAQPADEFQQLQEQLRVAQQQLQEAKAQLQAAKEHEAQLQTVKERERQLQSSRQQLQDIQKQIQDTLAELHETRTRISQYS